MSVNVILCWGKASEWNQNVYAESKAFVKIKWRDNSRVRRGWIKSTLLFNLYMHWVMKINVCENREGFEIGRERIVFCLFYADDLVFCDESKVSVRRLVEGFGGCEKKEGISK